MLRFVQCTPSNRGSAAALKEVRGASASARALACRSYHCGRPQIARSTCARARACRMAPRHRAACALVSALRVVVSARVPLAACSGRQLAGASRCCCALTATVAGGSGPERAHICGVPRRAFAAANLWLPPTCGRRPRARACVRRACALPRGRLRAQRLLRCTRGTRRRTRAMQRCEVLTAKVHFGMMRAVRLGHSSSCFGLEHSRLPPQAES